MNLINNNNKQRFNFMVPKSFYYNTAVVYTSAFLYKYFYCYFMALFKNIFNYIVVLTCFCKRSILKYSPILRLNI